MATKILKLQRNSVFSEKPTLKSHENTPLYITEYLTLIREGGRTVGSGRVATIIEEYRAKSVNEQLCREWHGGKSESNPHSLFIVTRNINFDIIKQSF